MDPKKAAPSREEILEKLRHFCSWSERSPRALRQKMARLGVDSAEWEALTSQLESEGFFNPSRFAASYQRGKSRLKGWGPAKIQLGLHREMEGTQLESEGSLSETDFSASLDRLRKEVQKRLNGKDFTRELEARLLRFCLSRGFSWETSREVIGQLVGRV